MADVKISELTALTSPDGAEELVVNDGGTTKKITITNATSASLPKAGGLMTGDTAHGDQVKSTYGNDNDLTIYHQGGYSYIHDSGTGPLYIRATDLILKSGTDNDTYAQFIENGAAELYYSNAKKLATTSSGVDVTGILYVNGDATGGRITGDGSGGLDLQDGNGRQTFKIMSPASGSSQSMTLDASGNLGIGTSSPQALLDIKGSTDSYAGMAKIYLTDLSSNSASRNWSIGNGGSAYGNFTIGVSNAKNGDPQASGTHINPLIITSEGIVTKPNQPAFHAMSGVGITNTSTFPVTKLEFSSALVNTGGHYSTTNDRFTAPVAGVYKFSVGFMSNGSIPNRFGFFKNGGIQGNVGYAIAAEYQRTSYELCITLAVNDYVDFRTNINAGTEGSVHADYRYFTGYLIG